MKFHPLADEYPLMSEHDLGRLEESMRERGFRSRFPIILYEGKILDGRNRWIAAQRAGVKPTLVTFKGTAEEASLFVQDANEERRHLTQEWLQKRREERIERVAERRREGASLRTIAEEEDVSEAQVRRDLEDAASTAPPGAVEPEGGKVLGKDGKERPSSRPKPELGPEMMRDKVGVPVPDWAKEAFAVLPLFEQALTLHRQLSRVVDEIAHSPGGEWFKELVCAMKERDGKQSFYIDKLRTLVWDFQRQRPHSALCPWCLAEGAKKNRKTCQACRGLPYITREAWDRCNPEYREAVEALAQEGGGE